MTTPPLPGFAVAIQRIELSPDSWLDHTACWLPDSAAALTELLAELPWTQEQLSMYGRRVNQPRLTAVCGRSMDPASRYTRRNADAPWTPRANAIRELVAAAVPDFDPNGLIANHYRDGRDSISWHADDENALGRYPLIASVSLGATRTLHLRPASGGPAVASLSLADGDLLVMGGRTQDEFQHAIHKSRQDGVRVSLTFRHYN